ncbi:MAG: hypothetical protein QG635_22, partial [Bacteroidota bacterium]|nr:hypothetical protein [Bacteroidota bacterium]
MDRRKFLYAFPAICGLGLANCKPPREYIVPAVNPDVELQAGLPTYYSSVFCCKNVASGITIKCYDGKPVKKEGNTRNPINGSSSNSIIQSELFNLYNSERLCPPTISGKPSELAIVLNNIKQIIHDADISGKTSAIILDEHCSPLLSNMIQDIENNSHIKFYFLPAIFSWQANANKNLLGNDGEYVPDFEKTDYILSVNWDILCS